AWRRQARGIRPVGGLPARSARHGGLGAGRRESRRDRRRRPAAGRQRSEAADAAAEGLSRENDDKSPRCGAFSFDVVGAASAASFSPKAAARLMKRAADAAPAEAIVPVRRRSIPCRLGRGGSAMMMRAWISKGLAAAVLLAVVAVAVAVPKHVREQTEASMLLTGTIDIAADGSVRGYGIDHEDKVPDYVLANIAGMVPGWRFEPTRIDGKPVAERVTMKLRMAAQPMAGGKFAIYIASAGFGQESGAKPTDTVSTREMNPPVFPDEVARMGGKGIVYLVLKIGRQGTVEDVAVEQVNLTAYASEVRMQRIRVRIAEAALKVARGW